MLWCSLVPTLLRITTALRLLRAFLLKLDVFCVDGCRVSVHGTRVDDVEVEWVLILSRALDILEERLIL